MSEQPILYPPHPCLAGRIHTDLSMIQYVTLDFQLRIAPIVDNTPASSNADRGSNGPTSTIYLVANYLGQGNNTGTILQFFGKYTDSWVKKGGGMVKS